MVYRFFCVLVLNCFFVVNSFSAPQSYHVALQEVIRQYSQLRTVQDTVGYLGTTFPADREFLKTTVRGHESERLPIMKIAGENLVIQEDLRSVILSRSDQKSMEFLIAGQKFVFNSKQNLEKTFQELNQILSSQQKSEFIEIWISKAHANFPALLIVLAIALGITIWSKVPWVSNAGTGINSKDMFSKAKEQVLLKEISRECDQALHSLTRKIQQGERIEESTISIFFNLKMQIETQSVLLKCNQPNSHPCYLILSAKKCVEDALNIIQTQKSLNRAHFKGGAEPSSQSQTSGEESPLNSRPAK